MGLPFALLGHPAHLAHVAAVVGRRLPPKALAVKLLEWAPPFVMAEFEVRSAHSSARGLYLTCPFLPETLAEQPFACLAKVRQAADLAATRGARLICLGGFTSIAARRGRAGLCLPHTTGGRLTAHLAVEACEEAAGLLGLELARATVAVIGGLGEVGGHCARHLAGRVGRLILTARRPQQRRLPEALHGAELLSDNDLAAAQAEVVIAAAASPAPLIDAAQLRPGAICCDVGYPPNVKDSGRGDVILFRGALARPPHPLGFGFDLCLPHPELTYGCFAEAMAMALEGETALPAEGLLAAFHRHGFARAGFWRGARELGPEEFERAALARTTRQGQRWL